MCSCNYFYDGGWRKRTHKHTYNAMGGVDVIFGVRTRKLLHIGVRNKLCYICSRAKTTGKEPKEHECLKHWEFSSQAMKSDIILVFLKEKYGVSFMRVIADGNSSVYSNIIKFVPVWGPYVQKIECANHATKCLRGNLEKLVSDKPHYKGKGGLTKSNILRITTGVRCAKIMLSNDSQCSRNDSVKKLRSDIRNAGRHVL